MPFASAHYPFENKESFLENFPGDFVSEGIDQTRGWFYTLLILSTHLFGTAPWKNLIVTGLVLAADGRKMSKSLRNYPDPHLIFDQYGADATRSVSVKSCIPFKINTISECFWSILPSYGVKTCASVRTVSVTLYLVFFFPG
jgi:isoleucyl-tRNA synthetase